MINTTKQTIKNINKNNTNKNNTNKKKKKKAEKNMLQINRLLFVHRHGRRCCYEIKQLDYIV